jgi:hypothetical protein
MMIDTEINIIIQLKIRKIKKIEYVFKIDTFSNEEYFI